jgi:hypothetical protein
MTTKPESESETITIPLTVEAFWGRVDKLEAVLRRQLPGLPFNDTRQVANAKMRAVLGWDGVRIYWRRPVDPPKETKATPLDAEELHKIFDAFQVTAATMLVNHGLDPLAENVVTPSAP